MTDVKSLDLLAPVAPALSTTSDMPKVGTPKEAPKGAVSQEEIDAGGTEAVKAAKAKEEADAKAAAEKEAADKAAAEAKAKKDDDEGDQTPAWQKREITKARNRQREAEARAATAENDAKALKEQLDRINVSLEKLAARDGSTIKTTEADPRPKRPVRSDFDDPDKYDAAMEQHEAALVDWSAKTAAKVTQAELEKQVKEREASEAKAKSDKADADKRQKVADAWAKSYAKTVEKYPDYAEVAENPEIQISQSMAMAMLQINKSKGNGPEIAYHLGKHPEEAARIAALDADDQFVEIAELAAMLKEKPTPVSKAPTPPKPIGSKARAIEKSPDEESMEEYAARRKVELRASPH